MEKPDDKRVGLRTKRWRHDAETSANDSHVSQGEASESNTRSNVLTVAEFEADPLEVQHRKIAVRKHQVRAANQLVQGVFIVIWVAITPALRSWLLNGVTLAFSDGSPIYWIAVVGVAALPAALGIWYFRMRWYRFRMYLEWREQGARADAREPETCSQGYMEMFRLYARTKRRATFTFIIGTVALYSAGYSAFIAAGNFDGLASGYVLLGAGLEVIAGLLILHVGFDISRKFVPGKILVTKTLIMSFLATTSQTNYTDARQQSLDLQLSMRERKPWWFYSYPEKPADDL